MQAAADLALALDPARWAERVTGWELDDWQEDVLRSPSRRVLLNCCRQSGKSTVAALLSLHSALYEPGILALLLSPSLRQSSELFRKISELYHTLEGPIPSQAESALRIELTNGSRIVSLPGQEQTVRGYSAVDLLVVDEAARVSDALYYSIRPMLAVSGGKFIALSTPFGKRGWWFREWSEGGDDWTRVEIVAKECPRINERFLEEERRRMPVVWFAQEYGCVFVEDEFTVFHHEDIMAAFETDAKPLFT